MSDLQFAFEELAACGEPVTESRKVNTHMSAIQVKEMAATKANIIGDVNDKAVNFANAQEYAQRMILSLKKDIPSERDDDDTARQVSETRKQDNVKHDDKVESGKRKLDPDVYYSDEYLAKYTEEEREEFFQAKQDRKAKKTKTTSEEQEQQQRQAAAVIQQLARYVSELTSVADSGGNDEATTNGNNDNDGQVQTPANPTLQFGNNRRGNVNGNGIGRH